MRTELIDEIMGAGRYAASLKGKHIETGVRFRLQKVDRPVSNLHT